MVSKTEVSSIRAVLPSQSAICVFDCSMAYGHISPANRAATVAMMPTATVFQKVCFSRKLNAINSINTSTTVSILLIILMFYDVYGQRVQVPVLPLQRLPPRLCCSGLSFALPVSGLSLLSSSPFLWHRPKLSLRVF